VENVRVELHCDRILSPGGAMEAFEAAKQAGKCHSRTEKYML
jgi:hypothetical protein